MTPSDIGAAYDLITDRWSSPSFDHHNGIAQHKRALSFLTQPGAALDVGCGCSGRIIDLLLTHGYTPEGIDVSGHMLRIARVRQPTIPFYHADITTWSFPHQYRFISAWDSIWHVPLPDQAHLLTRLCAALEPGGVLIFTIGGVDEPEERRNRAMGPELYYATLGITQTLTTPRRGR